MIKCESLHCTMSESSCLSRQVATNFDVHRSMRFPFCAKCGQSGQGASVLKAVNGSAGAMVRDLRHHALMRVRANFYARALARSIRWDRPEEMEAYR